MSTPTENIDYARTSSVTRMHAAAAREKSDPTAHATPISLGVIAAVAGFAILAGNYFGGNTGHNLSSANIYGYDYTKKFDGVSETGSGEMTPEEKHQPQNWIAFGASVYGTTCSSCHQPNGGGLAGKYPPLNKSEFVIAGEERLTAILLHGVVGALTVNGAAYNDTMQPLGTTTLNETQLAQVLSYIRNSWDNKGTVIYEDQIKEAKKKLGARASYSEAELRAMDANAHLPKSEWPDKLLKAGGGAAAPAADAKAPATPAPAPAAK